MKIIKCVNKAMNLNQIDDDANCYGIYLLLT